MFKRTRAALTAATLAFVAAGCSDSGTGPETGSLTEAESLAVFNEILAAFFTVQGESSMSLAAGDQPSFGLAPTPRPATTIDIDIEEAVPCEEGGSILVDGTMAIDVDDNGTGSYTFAFSQKPNGCVVVTQTGSKYEVDGNPAITMSGGYNVVGGELTGEFTMSFAGGLTWSAVNGGASGSCTIEMEYVVNWETLAGSAEGRLCGHDISRQF